MIFYRCNCSLNRYGFFLNVPFAYYYYYLKMFHLLVIEILVFTWSFISCIPQVLHLLKAPFHMQSACYCDFLVFQIVS